MPMKADTLKSGLLEMGNVDSEAEAIDNFMAAWSDFVYESEILKVQPTDGSLESALTTMQTALSGMNTPSAGAATMQAAIQAFWGAALPSAKDIWPIPEPNVLTAVAPIPVLSGIAAALTVVFASNTAGDLSKDDAAEAIANTLHPLQLGGIATITPPTPATPFTAPLT